MIFDVSTRVQAVLSCLRKHVANRIIQSSERGCREQVRTGAQRPESYSCVHGPPGDVILFWVPGEEIRISVFRGV